MLHIETIYVPVKSEVRYNWEYMSGSYDLNDYDKSTRYDNTSVIDNIMDNCHDECNENVLNNNFNDPNAIAPSHTKSLPFINHDNKSVSDSFMHMNLFSSENKKYDTCDNIPSFPLSQHLPQENELSKASWTNKNPTRENYNHKHTKGGTGKSITIRNKTLLPKKNSTFNNIKKCMCDIANNSETNIKVFDESESKNKQITTFNAMYQMLCRAEKHKRKHILKPIKSIHISNKKCVDSYNNSSIYDVCIKYKYVNRKKRDRYRSNGHHNIFIVH